MSSLGTYTLQGVAYLKSEALSVYVHASIAAPLQEGIFNLREVHDSEIGISS